MATLILLIHAHVLFRVRVQVVQVGQRIHLAGLQAAAAVSRAHVRPDDVQMRALVRPQVALVEVAHMSIDLHFLVPRVIASAFASWRIVGLTLTGARHHGVAVI